MCISMSFTALGEYGKYKVSLTANQNGKHSHVPSKTKRVDIAPPMGGSEYVLSIMNDKGNINDSYTTTDSGNGESHENMQPSKSVYFWKRTA